MARRRWRSRKPVPRGPVVSTARQDSPEQIWRKWEAMHASRTRLPTTLEAIRQSSWVYSAVTFIAEHIMRTPLQVFRGEERVDGHPVARLCERPNEYADQNTSAKFRYAYFVELLLHGAVMRLIYDLQGFRPQHMSVRPRWQFRVDTATDDQGRDVPARFLLQRPGRASLSFVPNDTIYHDALYNPLHDFEGLAPLTAALLSVQNDNDINEFAHRFFENDGSTGLVMTTDNPAFNQKQADDAARKWKEVYSGVSNAFGVKFVGFGLKPLAIGNPLDAKMLQTLRSFTKEEIVSGIFKVPLDAISAKDGGGDIVIGGPSGGTQASAREAFLVNVVMPWAARYDEEFNRDVTWRFDPSVEVRHDFTANPILERRRLERAMAVVELIDRGVPLNEAIRWLRLELTPQPHGDDWWIQNDRLPARIVLAAGDDALKIAIPAPGDGSGPAGPDAGRRRRRQAVADYVADVLCQAGSREFAESVRRDVDVRAASAGQSNGQRVAALLSSGNHGRLPLWDAGGVRASAGATGAFTDEVPCGSDGP